MSDLIERQEAIKIIIWADNWRDELDGIRALPRAEVVPLSVIEDIKAEVRKAQEEVYDAPQDVYEPDYWMREGMDYVLEIIDKHISGKENYADTEN